MIRASLFLLSIGGYCLFLAQFSPWPASQLPLFVVSALILALYLFSLAGTLGPGTYFLAIMGFTLGLAGLFRAFKRRNSNSDLVPGPGITVFFLLAASLWPVLSGTHYASWDEFSHWGLTAKEIFLRNALPPLESALRFKDYPPGTALFQYYVTFFTGWSEGATAFAQVMLLLSAAAALLRNISWEQGARLAVTLSFSYLLLVFFNYKPQSLYVDHVLGFLFGISIASSLLTEDGSLKTILRIVPVLLVLPLIKASGTVLAVIAAAAVTANHLIALWAVKEKKRWLPSILLCAALIAGPFAAAWSWNAHVADIGAAKTFSTSITPAGLSERFAGARTSTGISTIFNFTEAVFDKQVGRTLPPIFLILILTLAAFAAFKQEERLRENLQARAALLCMLAGFLVYAAGLLLLYVFSFSAYEGLKLASFGRYMGTFFLAWSLVTAAFFLRLPEPRTVSRFRNYAGKLVVLTALVYLGVNSFKKASAEKTLLHADIRGKAEYAAARTPSDARIYVIWQGSDGFEPQVMAYELSPRITSTRGGGWSLGKPYGPEDVWTVDMSPEEWAGVLKDYDYVLVGRADDRFWDEFGALFGSSASARPLFKVIPGNSGTKLQAL